MTGKGIFSLLMFLILQSIAAQKLQLVNDSTFSSELSDIQNLVAYNSNLYFAGSQYPVYHQLFRTNGTAAGTYTLSNITPNFNRPSGEPVKFIEANGLLFFYQHDGISHAKKLWITNGTVAGTKMVKDLGESDWNGMGYYTEFKNQLFFVVSTNTSGAEI